MAASTVLVMVSIVSVEAAEIGVYRGRLVLSLSHLSRVSVRPCSVRGLAQDIKVLAEGGRPCLNVSALNSKSGVMALASFETLSIYWNGFSCVFHFNERILTIASCLDDTSENCRLNRLIMSS